MTDDGARAAALELFESVSLRLHRLRGLLAHLGAEETKRTGAISTAETAAALALCALINDIPRALQQPADPSRNND